MLPLGFRTSHTLINPSKEPLANMFWFSGDGERLDTKPSWPLRVVIVIDCDRGSWSRILFVVVPSASTDMEESDDNERRGAVNGVEDTA